MDLHKPRKALRKQGIFLHEAREATDMLRTELRRDTAKTGQRYRLARLGIREPGCNRFRRMRGNFFLLASCMDCRLGPLKLDPRRWSPYRSYTGITVLMCEH
jgi:hypothetical protein